MARPDVAGDVSHAKRRCVQTLRMGTRGGRHVSHAKHRGRHVGDPGAFDAATFRVRNTRAQDRTPIRRCGVPDGPRRTMDARPVRRGAPETVRRRPAERGTAEWDLAAVPGPLLRAAVRRTDERARRRRTFRVRNIRRAVVAKTFRTRNAPQADRGPPPRGGSRDAGGHPGPPPAARFSAAAAASSSRRQVPRRSFLNAA